VLLVFISAIEFYLLFYSAKTIGALEPFLYAIGLLALFDLVVFLILPFGLSFAFSKAIVYL